MALKKHNLTKEVKSTQVIQGTGVATVSVNVETLKDVYIKVEEFSGDKNNIQVTLLFSTDRMYWREIKSFQPTMDGGNFISQAYEYLKALEEFKDSIDC